jgi:hypothetical protein
MTTSAHSLPQLIDVLNKDFTVNAIHLKVMIQPTVGQLEQHLSSDVLCTEFVNILIHTLCFQEHLNIIPRPVHRIQIYMPKTKAFNTTL